MTEREQLEQARAALEGQRPVPGDDDHRCFAVAAGAEAGTAGACPVSATRLTM